MDFFEKAHVVKKDSSRKDHKSEDAVKKQLKQLLHGYKQCDSNIIKQCEEQFDSNKFNEDSSSVSGFSDLNLTESSNEIDSTRETLETDSEDENISNSDEVCISKVSDLSNIDQVSDQSSTNNQLSPSEYKNNFMDNLSTDINLESLSVSNDNSSLTSINLSEVTSESDSNEFESFDADGALATRILEKLSKRKVLNRKAKKRKLKPDFTTDKLLESKINELSEESNSLPSNDKENINVSVIDEKSESNESASDNSPFISVKVNEMQNQSLSEILGEYRFPTVKNLPSEVQNVCATNNSGLFSIEDMDVEDIHIQEEISSLSPECENDFTLEEDDIPIADPDNNFLLYTDTASVCNDEIPSEDTPENEITMDSIDSNFEVPIKIFYGNNSCIFVLKHPAVLYIHGKVKAKVLGGTVEILGYILQNDNYEVYAPNYNFAQSLKTVANENVYNGLFGKLIAEGLSVPEAEEITTELGEHDGVISLSKLTSHKMDFVENNMISTDLFSRSSKNVDAFLKNASEILACSLYLQKPKVFEELSVSKQVLNCAMAPQSRGIICGGKGVGKSTFLRYCVNRLLSRGPVLVIDLDPGQAEFTVAGSVSATVVDTPLLGPNFTHLKTPIKMLNLGMINTMDNPRRYAVAVNALISYCHNDEQLKSLPWIINTMGMCNAMGLKFMTLVILQAKPTYLLQIDSKNAKKRFEHLFNPSTVQKLYQNYKKDPLLKNVNCLTNLNYSFLVESNTDGSVKNNYSLAPRDERYLNFLAYFGELLSSRSCDLLGIKPYEVRFEDLHIGLNVKIDEDSVQKVINGKIVALCQQANHDKSGKVFTLKDKPLLCHGHGLIRGVDFEKKLLYIITPIAVDKLSLVDTLVYADWVPELRGQERHLPDGVPIPYRTATVYQKRQLMFAPKRRFNPLQLLKISRNT